MRATKTHWYKGEKIVPCEYADSKPWYVERRHKSGLRWNEQNCPQFYSLKDAKEYIDQLYSTYAR